MCVAFVDVGMSVVVLVGMFIAFVVVVGMFVVLVDVGDVDISVEVCVGVVFDIMVCLVINGDTDWVGVVVVNCVVIMLSLVILIASIPACPVLYPRNTICRKNNKYT
jgi:hypothetical protein